MLVTLATEAGTPGWPNEDFTAATPEAAVLLDGATTVPRGAGTGCRHGVAWYARTLGTTLLAAISGPAGIQLADALAGSIGHVAGLHRDTCDLTDPRTPAATVVAVRADSAGFSYLVLSDSTFAADFGDGRAPLVVTGDHVAAKASPAAAAAASTGSVSRAGLRGVALLSDGVTRITDLYRLLGWPGAMDVIRDRGPAALIGQVRSAERADAGCTRWPRHKPSDDATVLWWPAD
ncbi:MAG TPA: hypothetical protein VGI64_07890 [Streptosporangiaceae bacterium]